MSASLPKYLVHNGEHFGGARINLFDQKDQAIDYMKEWIEQTDGKVAVIMTIFEPDGDGLYTPNLGEHSEWNSYNKELEDYEWDLCDKELRDSYNKLMLLDSELTKLNGGTPLPQPPKGSSTPSSYVLGDDVNLQTLPDENETYSIHLAGTCDGISRFSVKYKSVCGDGRSKTPQQVYEAYKTLSGC
jgi:hypothetical protein